MLLTVSSKETELAVASIKHRMESHDSLPHSEACAMISLVTCARALRYSIHSGLLMTSYYFN